MPAPKSLDQHVREGTFRARRHYDLLAGPVVEWPELALLQARYAGTTHELERRAIAVEFERAVRELTSDEDERAERDRAQQELDELLAQVDEVDPDQDAALAERFRRGSWAAYLRRGGLSYRAIGEKLGGMSAASARRLVLAFEERGASVGATGYAPSSDAAGLTPR